jgi:phosphoglycolate phosphatase-like HAD superfamily hydrolase
MTSSKDVDVAKPEPGIIQVALDRAGVDADHAVYLGDAVWDIVACKNAGVSSIGVLSGGVSREELGNAGAEQVFDNARELCERIDDTAIAALRA